MIAACVEADVAVRDPDIAALQNRAASLKRQRRYEDALIAYEAVLALDGGNLHALNECGGLHVWLGRPAAAVACYDRALAIAPRTLVLQINKGTAQVALNRLAEGLASFEAALAIDPESAEAHYDASLVRLRLGDFRNGWREYEWRWRKGAGRPDIGAPLWLGEESLLNKTILLLAEQGFGDTINFMRYAPLVAARGATVILGVQSQLKAIAATVPGVALALGAGEPVPSVDFYCPLLSLPHAFKTELATVPANIPYVRPDSERLAKWRDRLAANGRLRVGICWAGSNIHLNDRNRSIPLERFATILVSGIDFISLQRDVAPPEAAILSAHGVRQIGQEFSDFADTAAVVSMLDLVISVDTSVAHLAGAMAKATAVLIPFAPDFRWLLDRTDSPWYPTLRLFRQAAIGDWSGPLDRLHHELAAVAAKRG
jgi:tetratricopeptide (TPR) repeat protein